MQNPVLITAIAATLFASPVIGNAQTAAQINPSNLILADDISDGDIYSDMSDVPWTDDTTFEVVAKEWESIGEIEDVVLDRDGQMVGVVADVGGFLGIGNKHVLLPMEEVRIIPLSDGDDDYALVVKATEESLKAMPEVEKGLFD